MFKQFDKLMKSGRFDKVVKFMEGKKKKKRDRNNK